MPVFNMMFLDANTQPISLYDADYQLWLAQTVAQLRSRDFGHLDLENLIEEIESWGRSEKHAVASYLMRLCEHLLKIQYWEADRETCFRGWDREVTNFRLQLQEYLDASPSLQVLLHEIFPKQYQNGRKLFLKSSRLNPQWIPEMPCFRLVQALDEDWLPWQPA